MVNPARDITKLQTHFERLSANNAPVSAYEQGMILLSAIPDEWDHIAAYYVQTCAAVTNVSFDAIRKAILAEFDRSGRSRQQDQTHIADKLSAIKRKGKTPQFKQQRGTNHQSTADDQASPSSNKRRCNCPNRGPKPGGNSHHHSHLASTLMLEGGSQAPL